MANDRRRLSEHKGYSWFPFDVVDHLTNSNVAEMNSSEEGLYVRLKAVQWRDGKLASDPKLLSTQLGRDRRLVTRWLQKWCHLLSIVQPDGSHLAAKWVQDGDRVEPDGRYMVFEELYKTAVSVGKTTVPGSPEESREHERTGETEDSRCLPATSSSNPLLLPVQLEQGSAPAAHQRHHLADIREWDEDRFGVTADRLRNCIIYQLDYAGDTWYRKKARITPGRMNSEAFVRKLDDDTPPGWTPEGEKTLLSGGIDRPVVSDATLALVRQFGGRINGRA